jgi:glycine oxidase
MDDVLIIGGGVIGLSLAWDLARHGTRVHLIDQGEPGREASWAGAGILPPSAFIATQHPAEQLRGLASQLHPQWAEELRTITGIDNGYRLCGGLYLANTPGESAALAAWADSLREDAIEAIPLNAADLRELEPGIAVPAKSILLPTEAQLRNPRHLKALLAACQSSGVTITRNAAASDFAIDGDRLRSIQTSFGQTIEAGKYCFTAGAWTGQLLKPLGISAGILPIRGQIILFKCERPPITRIVNAGSRYLVPREDGYVLAGSTEEEVGFDKRTTAEAIQDLKAFACDLVPELKAAAIERTWAGLRPGTVDGLPYLGRLPGLTNTFVAAGHFRTGLYLSPATAVVMSQLIREEAPMIDIAPLGIGR